MSQAALLQRLHKLTNLDKLRSFIQARLALTPSLLMRPRLQKQQAWAAQLCVAPSLPSCASRVFSSQKQPELSNPK